jgi:hypothetical protein
MKTERKARAEARAEAAGFRAAFAALDRMDAQVASGKGKYILRVGRKRYDIGAAGARSAFRQARELASAFGRCEVWWCPPRAPRYTYAGDAEKRRGTVRCSSFGSWHPFIK